MIILIVISSLHGMKFRPNTRNSMISRNFICQHTTQHVRDFHWQSSPAQISTDHPMPAVKLLVWNTAFSFICLSVRALKGKRLQLSTPNLVDLQIMGGCGRSLPWGQKVRVKVKVKLFFTVCIGSMVLPVWSPHIDSTTGTNDSSLISYELCVSPHQAMRDSPQHCGEDWKTVTVLKLCCFHRYALG